MDPTVVAAWIAAAVSALTLVGTLAAQYFGSRSTGRQLDRTFVEQRVQALNERFATAAEQFGSDKPAVRLAGVYAMAGLADDWEKNRQVCIDVLCAYLRMPYEPDPGQEAPAPARLAFQANREVRHTVIRVIAAHLRPDAAVSWQGRNLDFTGTVFDGADFSHAHFSGGTVLFEDTQFLGAEVKFVDTIFEAEQFPTGGFSGIVSFARAKFTADVSAFVDSRFAGFVFFGGADFAGGIVHFGKVEFSSGLTTFDNVEFSGAEVKFDEAKFSGGMVGFRSARFTDGEVDFRGAEFSGAEVDFSQAGDWSNPPKFPWKDTPPPGAMPLSLS